MSEEKKKKQQATPETAPQEQSCDCTAELEALKKENAELAAAVEKAKAEAADAKDKLLRTAAEYDNYRKRTLREKDGIYADAVSGTVEAFLPVADNLERALGCEAGEGLRQGLELIMKQLADTLKKLNVSAIDPVGEQFDPNLHNAVMHIEDESLSENTVAEVLQKGYAIGSKVVRHAVVKVAN